MSAQHTPGPGLEISLRIGQRVRHHDHGGKRVTGQVHGLSIDSDRVLQADIVLDAPIVIPKCGADDRDISIWRQHVPAHELTPFDDRDELIGELVSALQVVVDDWTSQFERNGHLAPAWCRQARAAIAKANGSAA